TSVNSYSQEFYIFIPNSLYINEEVYTSKQFYEDQTNFIRYKTPEQNLKQIVDPEFKASPLSRLKTYLKQPHSKKNLKLIEDEVKLLGNIVRSAIRRRVKKIIDGKSDIIDFCNSIEKFQKEYIELKEHFHQEWGKKTSPPFIYTQEFMSKSIQYYLTGLLKRKEHTLSTEEREVLTDTIIKEIEWQKKSVRRNSHEKETVLYRLGLLNKYVLDALLLQTSKESLYNRFRNVIGSVSAGIAMLFFFVLFVWGGQVLIINSTPFILLTVILYILKDRLKEGLRELSYRNFHKWFSDFQTDILTPEGTKKIGHMTESFSFVNLKKLPHDITYMRNREFHEVLDRVKRPEKVIYYKKKIQIQLRKRKEERRYGLNIISRFNISSFTKYASNSRHNLFTIDESTREVKKIKLPKVYHLNVILKNTTTDEKGRAQIEYKKFRIVLNKEGIVRVEHLPSKI
ncbi:MAG: hypothetical protein WD595_04020, partial [Waddliaceae bacterium]